MSTTQADKSVAAPPSRTSDVPEYGGPWFHSPFFEDLLDQSGLSPEERSEVERFARDGYLVLENEQLGLPDFEALSERIIADAGRLYGGAGRIQDGWVVSEAIKSLALAPGVLATLERLYRRRVVPFQTLNFETGTQQSTHSDTVHFHCLPKFFMCGVWVALEDTDVENGPVHYYPGSHKLPDIDVLDLAAEPVGNRDTKPVEERYARFVAAMMERSGLERKQLTVEKGQALIWAANLYHGGDPVLDQSRTRQSQVTHYYFEDCLYYNPLRSDIATGRLAVQRPRNILTGERQPLQVDGRRIPVTVSDRLRWHAPTVMQKLRIWKKDSRRF